MYQFGFIGMGNMGSAMLKGCLSVFPASALAFSRKDAVKGKALSLETGAVWVDSNRACAEQSRYIILAVKPQFYDGVLKEIQPVLDDSRIIISLAPSYTIADLKQSLGASARIIRAMPNTPAMVGEGTGFSKLTTTDIKLNSEEYGVGFRKGSDLAAKLNEFLKTAYADGTMIEIAKLYGVQESLIAQ